MSKVVYWMSVSLDGFVETRDGKIDWTAPDDELHRFFNSTRAKSKQEVSGDLGVCGATLAGSLMRLGLIDEYRLFVRPIVLGGGKAYFPPLENAANLRLAETRTFPRGVVLLRYEPDL